MTRSSTWEERGAWAWPRSTWSSSARTSPDLSEDLVCSPDPFFLFPAEQPERLRSRRPSMRWTTNLLKAAVCGFFLLGICTGTRATHLVGAEIDVYHLGSDQYEVRLLLWRDCMGTSAASFQGVAYQSPCGNGTL